MADEKKKYRDNIGAFWLREDKRGSHYMTGFVEIEGVKHELVIFTNTFKTRPTQPDYVVRPQVSEKGEDHEK